MHFWSERRRKKLPAGCDDLGAVRAGSQTRRVCWLIYNQKPAEVSFTFEYETNQYRIIRSLTRGKTTLLEFQILNGEDWRPLTEHTNRETQGRIENVLRLDYDTFINVSFFLQGRADQFAQQVPTRRKEILGNILGLEIWEAYRERTAEKRKKAESSLGGVDGHVAEIELELAEEEPRKKHLSELERQLGGLTTTRKLQEAALASIKQVRGGLERTRDQVQKMEQSLSQLKGSLTGLETRLVGRETERKPYSDIVGRADEVEAAYKAWLVARKETQKWEEIAAQFHEQEKLRLPFVNEIITEKVKLEQELETLTRQGEEVDKQLQSSAASGSGVRKHK